MISDIQNEKYRSDVEELATYVVNSLHDISVKHNAEFLDRHYAQMYLVKKILGMEK